MRCVQRSTKRGTTAAVIFFLLVAIFVSQQRSTAEDSTTTTFRIPPLRLDVPSSQQTGQLPNLSADPSAQAIADRLREQLAARQATQNRNATLAAMTSDQARSFTALEKQIQAAVEIRLRPSTGTPMQIVSPMLQPSVANGAPGVDHDEKTARMFLRTYSDLLRLDNSDQELMLAHHEVDDLRRSHLRFSQQYQNLPVWPAEVLIHLDPNGHVDAVEGSSVPTPRKILTNPVIDAQAAIVRARTIVPDGEKATAPSPTLILYSLSETTPKLAWKIELSVTPTSRWLVVIDAVNGTTLTAYNQVTDANVVGSGIDVFGTTRPLNVFSKNETFFMIDTSKQMYDPTSDPPNLDATRGAIVVLDAGNRTPDAQGRISLSQVTSNSATSGWLPDAVSASFSLAQTYDYYLERHNRNSLDGQGGTILGIVRFGTNYANAAWNGQLILFGDALPFAGALDVVAHELTHGVTQYSANLVYLNQSGALNEAFSDIFGEATEARTTGGGPDWILGSQLSTPVRNLATPNAVTGEVCPNRVGHPAKMSEFLVTAQDNGGVHCNSTIFSHAFYLLAQGMPNAIGIRDAERIFYRALTTHLVSNAQFIDARLACIQSATELFGAGSPQVSATATAFDQVEITDAPPSPGPSTIPAVNGPDATLFLRREQGALVLGRREEGRGDNAAGVRLSSASAKGARPAVSGDGSFAVFVNSANDLCLIPTDGSTAEACVGFPGLIGSASISRDGSFAGLVLLSGGQRDNHLSVLDLRPGGTSQTYTLVSPAIDGVSANSVKFADSMDFTADNRTLVYDAFNEVALTDGSRFGVWSIYALDLATGTTQVIIPPTRGVDIAFPFLGQTSNDLLTFDESNQSSTQSTVFSCRLSTGDCVKVATVNGEFGVPSYTGDDSAIIYSQGDTATATGSSLMRQPLASDHQTPAGTPALWISNADFNVIYRRATQSNGGVALENPAPGSFQSGVGLISGWICNANRVEIDVDGRATLQAAYGTARGDTQSVCGDSNNGFGLLINWNLLGNDTHRVRILADGVEIASSTFTVTTLGLGDFPRNLSGAFTIPNFPQGGTTTRVQWQESTQNFVITNASGSSPGGGSNNPGTSLENPAPGSFQSGISLISGWICNASRVEIDVDGRATLQAAYGTIRGDTQGVCGDTNNGYGLLINWNLLGDGTHFVRILADGVEVGRSTFTVATLGLGDFPRGLSGTFTLANFPQSGKSTQIQWQENGQNFVVTNVQ